MKLDEITSLTSDLNVTGFDFEHFDYENEQQVGTAENISLFLLHPKDKTAYDYAYVLKKDGKYISWVIGNDTTVHGVKYFIVRRLWTDPQFRRQGFASALYSAIVRKLQVKMLSDSQQGPAARGLWKQLRSALHVSALNYRTGEKVDLSQLTDSDIYKTTDDDEQNVYLLVAEAVGLYAAGGCFERAPHYPSIVDDYLIYTDPSQLGKYE